MKPTDADFHAALEELREYASIEINGELVYDCEKDAFFDWVAEECNAIQNEFYSPLLYIRLAEHYDIEIEERAHVEERSPQEPLGY